MSIQRPTVGREGEMTLPPSAWPEADEDQLRARREILVGFRPR